MADLVIPELVHDLELYDDAEGSITGIPNSRRKIALFSGSNDAHRFNVTEECLLGRSEPGAGPVHIIRIGAGLSLDFDPAQGVGMLAAEGGSAGAAAEWFIVAGPPESSMGDELDLWLDVLNGDVFKKVGGAWTFEGNIRGPAGVGLPGAPGSKWRFGVGTPSNALGIDGDSYLDLSTGDVYEKQAGAYALLGSMRGPAGPGIPADGIANQFLRKVSNTPYDTAWYGPLGKADVGLGNVDDTTDLLKPISTATQTALNAKLASSVYTAADVLAKLLTVDGSGSAIDADLLDGQDGTAYEKIANKAIANGYASLDSSGKVPTAQLPASVIGGVAFQGTWNAATNTPTIPAAVSTNKGFYYRVATAGSTNVDGETDWKVGDWIISEGTVWTKLDHTDQVVSVGGKSGAVVLVVADISDSGTTGRSLVQAATAAAAKALLTLVAADIGDSGATGRALLQAVNAAAAKTALALVKADVGLGNVDNTTDASKPVSTAQAAANVTNAPMGISRFQYLSTTQCVLYPAAGYRMRLNTVFRDIPNGGLVISNTGLSANVIYYFYAYDNAGVLGLTYSTTAPALVGGIWVYPPDANYIVVGMGVPNASGQFEPMRTLSFYNRRLKTALLATGNVSTTAQVTNTVTTGAAIANWASEAVNVTWYGQGNTDASFSQCCVGIDGATVYGAPGFIYGPTGALSPTFSIGGDGSPAEGLHTYYGCLGRSSGDGTTAYSFNSTLAFSTMG